MKNNKMKKQKPQIPEVDETKYCSPAEALKMAKKLGIGITHATLLTWVEKHRVGVRPGGVGSHWFVDKTAFLGLLEGKFKKRVENGKDK